MECPQIASEDRPDYGRQCQDQQSNRDQPLLRFHPGLHCVMGIIRRVMPGPGSGSTIGRPRTSGRPLSALVDYGAQSAMKILVSCGALALRLEAQTNCLPSGLNMGNPSK